MLTAVALVAPQRPSLLMRRILLDGRIPLLKRAKSLSNGPTQVTEGTEKEC